VPMSSGPSKKCLIFFINIISSRHPLDSVSANGGRPFLLLRDAIEEGENSLPTVLDLVVFFPLLSFSMAESILFLLEVFPLSRGKGNAPFLIAAEGSSSRASSLLARFLSCSLPAIP